MILHRQVQKARKKVLFGQRTKHAALSYTLYQKSVIITIPFFVILYKQQRISLQSAAYCRDKRQNNDKRVNKMLFVFFAFNIEKVEKFYIIYKDSIHDLRRQYRTTKG